MTARSKRGLRRPRLVSGGGQSLAQARCRRTPALVTAASWAVEPSRPANCWNSRNEALGSPAVSCARNECMSSIAFAAPEVTCLDDRSGSAMQERVPNAVQATVILQLQDTQDVIERPVGLPPPSATTVCPRQTAPAPWPPQQSRPAPRPAPERARAGRSEASACSQASARDFACACPLNDPNGSPAPHCRTEVRRVRGQIAPLSNSGSSGSMPRSRVAMPISDTSTERESDRVGPPFRQRDSARHPSDGQPRS
jgi:hypothetical protein